MGLNRVLVTGGAGFIGSHTIDLLLESDTQVVVLDNLTSGKLENLNLSHPNIEFIEGDVLDLYLLDEIIASCDAVLHLAAIASVPYSLENPVYSFQVNTQGFLHVLTAIHKAKRSIRLVYASSAAVYGNTSELPSRDDVPLTDVALSPYAMQKIHCEDYANLYARLFGVKSLGLRYFNVYGPRQDAASPYSGVISRFLAAYQNNESLTLFGDGTQTRDFIHVADVAKANVLALNHTYAGVLNIATGVGESLLQLIQYLEAIGEREAHKVFQPAREGDINASYAAVSKAKECLRFQTTLDLAHGLKTLF